MQRPKTNIRKKSPQRDLLRLGFAAAGTLRRKGVVSVYGILRALSLPSFAIDAVSMAGRARDDEELDGLARFISGLMLNGWFERDRVTGRNDDRSRLCAHGQFAAQHIEQLPSFEVEVHYLSSPGRHLLLDHVNVFILQEEPAIASFTPRVVFGGLG